MSSLSRKLTPTFLCLCCVHVGTCSIRSIGVKTRCATTIYISLSKGFSTWENHIFLYVSSRVNPIVNLLKFQPIPEKNPPPKKNSTIPWNPRKSGRRLLKIQPCFHSLGLPQWVPFLRCFRPSLRTSSTASSTCRRASGRMVSSPRCSAVFVFAFFDGKKHWSNWLIIKNTLLGKEIMHFVNYMEYYYYKYYYYYHYYYYI